MSFYSTQNLSRQGPLRLLWTAAHLERQLKRPAVEAASVSASVEQLLGGLGADVPLALRLNGQLLLGLVRIYRKKVDYLQSDCQAVLERVATSGAAPAAAAAAQHPGGDGLEGSQQQPGGGAPAAAPRRARRGAPPAGAGGGGSEPAAPDGLGFEVDMSDAFDLSGPWGSQSLDALPSLGSQASLGGGGASQQRGLPAAASSHGLADAGGLLGSLGGWRGGSLDPEVFELDGDAGLDDASAFDLTELDVAALRASSVGPSTQRAAAAAAAEAAAEAEAEAAAAELSDGAAAAAAAAAEGGAQLLAPAEGEEPWRGEEEEEVFGAGGYDLDALQPLPARGGSQRGASADGSPAGSSEGEQHSCHTPQQAPPAPGDARAPGGAQLAWEGAAARREGQEVPFQGLTERGAAAAPDTSAAAAAKSARRAAVLRQLFGPLGAAQLDDDASRNRITTELPGATIRALLADRSPLLDLGRGAHRARQALLLHAGAGGGAAAGGGPTLGAAARLQLLSNALPLGSPGEALAAAAANGGAFACCAEFDAAAGAVLRALLPSGGAELGLARPAQLLRGSVVSAAAVAAAAATGPAGVGGLGPWPGGEDAGGGAPAGEDSSPSLAALGFGTGGRLAAAAPAVAFSPRLARSLLAGVAERLAAVRVAGGTVDAGAGDAGPATKRKAGRKPAASAAAAAAEPEQLEVPEQQRQEDVAADQAGWPAADEEPLWEQEQLEEEQEEQQEGSEDAAGEQQGAPELLLTEGEGGEGTRQPHGHGGRSAAARDASAGFTSNTRRVLNTLKHMLAAQPGAVGGAAAPAAGAAGKRKQPGDDGGAGPASGAGVAFSALLRHACAGGALARPRRGGGARPAVVSGGGGAHDAPPRAARLDVSRSFYELLVLQNRGYLALAQAGPYGELSLTPRPKLLADGGAAAP
ncbi:SYN4 [Scenedesmus sp. PABB004]|nr:SYN4 [Scenedesmus sp. PABB004]